MKEHLIYNKNWQNGTNVVYICKKALKAALRFFFIMDKAVLQLQFIHILW